MCALYLTSRGSEEPEGKVAFDVGGEDEAALDDEGETAGCIYAGPVECCQPQGADMSATQLGKPKTLQWEAVPTFEPTMTTVRRWGRCPDLPDPISAYHC